MFLTGSSLAGPVRKMSSVREIIEDVADFRPSASMLLTDDAKRNAQGLLDRAGTVFNTKQVHAVSQ